MTRLMNSPTPVEKARPLMTPLPYKIAVLCYVYDDDGRVLLLHRRKMPNAGMYSPIGGKLDVTTGESPHDCAAREMLEEIGVEFDDEQIHLCGVVSEAGYEGETHWLMFLFEVLRPVSHDELAWTEFDEGTLEWVPIDEVDRLDLPETDRRVMWPLIRRHRRGFFMAHIDCTGDEIAWRVVESRPTAE